MGAHDQRRSGNCAQTKQARDRSESCTNTATEAHKDPVLADRHLCYICAAVPRWTCRPPVCNNPCAPANAGRPAVAAPARTGRCRGASSARSPAMLALAATAQRPRRPPPSSGENPEAGNRYDQGPTRRLFAGSAHTRLGAQGECSGGGSGLAPAATAALRPNSVASRSPLQLQRPSPDTIPESIQK